ncbi:PAS domain S-box protein [Mucilaginibacter gilvus]|uniref:histidine kinase n=1 Tax=Mucilaginibacter gilvus TaxID=2305909 RepID=A0A3S3V092_9SPHI|nr:PAS domain S-box protein [Mucilaginibacter gilvus]RWY52441.1 PAS domain S-box protein [Mucilaginibacter gilvus]
MLNKFSVSAKLYLLLFITAVSIVGLGVYGISDLEDMNQNTQTLYTDRVLPFEQLSNVRFAYTTEILTVAQKVANRTLSFSDATKRVKQAEETINYNWGSYRQTYLTPEEAVLVKQTERTKQKAYKQYTELLILLTKQDYKALEKFIQTENSAGPAPFTVNLTQLMKFQVRVGKQIFTENNKIYHTTSKRFIILISGFLAIALSLSLYIIKNIRTLIKGILVRNDAIKETQEKYYSLFEQASDAIFIMNSEGNFTEANDSMCQLTGYSRDELLAMNVTDILNAEIIKMYPLVYATRKLGESVTGERKVVQKNGKIIDIEINGKKFTDDRITIISRDITARKAMEAELINAELKFRTLADKSMVGIYIVQKGKFVYVNPRFAEVFGYEASELIGREPVEAIVHPNYQAISNENIRLRVEGEVDSVHYEAMGKMKDGSANWVEFYGSRAVLEDEPTIIGSMIDITERKIAEEELKASEKKYKLLFESNPVPLWIIAKDDLSIIAANEAASNLYGYSKDELLNTSVKQLRPIEDWEQQQLSYQKKITGTVDFGVVRHVKKNGTPIFVSIISEDILFEGRPVRISSTVDVTEKLKAEEMLKKSEANLQTILNTTDTAYALLDHEFNVLEYNEIALLFAKQEFNFNPGESTNFFEHLPESRRTQFLGYIKEVFKGNTISYEATYDQPDGGNIWYYVKIFPISNKENEILGLVLAISDITERKNGEQSLQLAYQRIKTNIGFIREMIWKQSHILRSPLANLKGLITILQSDPGDEEVLAHIKTELDRMDAVFIEMAQDTSADDMNY